MSVLARDLPYQGEHYDSKARRMEQGKMPKTLDGLVRWYLMRFGEETPDRLHRFEVWHDAVSVREREAGQLQHRGIEKPHIPSLECWCGPTPERLPMGGSHLGASAWSGLFRLILEGSPSATDEDGYYITPVRSALSRISRRWPFMARILVRLGMTEGDWRAVADALGWPHEAMEVYLEEALRRLWRETYDRTTRGA